MDAPLNERLEAYSKAVRDLIPAYADAVDRLVARLSRSDAGAGAPQPGELMPPFVLPDETGRLTSLDALLRDGPLAITFHRGHWCPWCRISASALAKVQNEIMGTGGQVAAVMPERQAFAAEFKVNTGSQFSVLTDMDNGYALSLNLAIWIGPDLVELLSSFGRFLPDYQGNDTWMLPIPATGWSGHCALCRPRLSPTDFGRAIDRGARSRALRAVGRDRWPASTCSSRRSYPLVVAAHLALMAVLRSAGEMRTPKRSHQMITLSCFFTSTPAGIE
jgi:peroxiredoxin